VENIAYEAFSPFAAAFEEVRKVGLLLLISTHRHPGLQVEIDFFLTHWHEIRTSGSMKNVWLQIRNGRHPGFEEGWLYNIIYLFSFDGLLMIQHLVWPLIVQSLEFKPSTPTCASAGAMSL
jgi:hypothetical protein